MTKLMVIAGVALVLFGAFYALVNLRSAPAEVPRIPAPNQQ